MSDQAGSATADALALSPHGVLLCGEKDTPLAVAFSESEEAGLFHLGGHPLPTGADAAIVFWKGIADDFLRALCHLPEGSSIEPVPPEPAWLADRVLNAPPMRGAEYLSPSLLAAQRERLALWTRKQAEEAGGLANMLERRAPAWTRVGRVTLHLAENKNDPELPFAFMATYASGVSGSGRLTQLPLGKALREFGGAQNKPALLKLLTPLHAAAKQCPLMAGLVENGDIFHPLAWTPAEAYQFLKNVPLYDNSGLLVRLPNWWRKRAARPKVAGVIGSQKKSGLGLATLLDFKTEVVVGDRKLAEEEIRELLQSAGGLVLFRGEWIEVNREKLQQALDHWRAIEEHDGLSFAEGMRLLAGAPRDLRDSEEIEAHREWAFACPGEWLEEVLASLASPPPLDPPKALRAELRPYQSRGLDWLWFCARAGFGACLADDMGLGKTVQVLAALLRRKETMPGGAPSLLVVPASLIGNWKRETQKFAPGLRYLVAHPSEPPPGRFPEGSEPVPADVDFVLTTYGMLLRWPRLSETEWSWVILDEAQAVKNHASKQSKAVRSLRSAARFALTGTPVENSPADLWSLFDFLNPGLLGSSTRFSEFLKRLRTDNSEGYAPLRRMVAPYILRRLKTDRSIAPDLPDKTEMKVFCGLTQLQSRLYKQTAEELAKRIETTSGIERRGLVLAYLMRFKQICNHPDQLIKTGAYDPGHSAKFLRLGEICGEISSRGEKVLVFTQFREITDPLRHALAKVFGRDGLVLHGETKVSTRQELVNWFQREDGPPFFVLSLKAGGTGLNLTAASHVVHFDRWWNPAVENQATDRAFRIGQQKNVLVHKFVTSGTLEEKIDALLTEKQETADALLDGGAEKLLTEMSNEELLDFVRLDIEKAEQNL